MEHRRGGYAISTDPARLDLDVIHGYLSGEWIGWEPYAVHLPRELAAMRAYERELARG